MIEWYDFYIFGSLAAVLSPEILSARQRHLRAHCLSRHFRRWLPGAPVWSALLRTHRRSRRPQVCLPGDALDHGRRHRSHRPAAHLRNRRLVRPHHSAPDSHPARAWPLAANMAAPRFMSPSTCPTASAASTPASFKSPPRSACSSPCSSSSFTQQSMSKEDFAELGLAHSLPHFHHPCHHLPLHPSEDEGIPDLHQIKSRWHDFDAAADRRLRQMGQPQARLHFPVRRHRRTGCGLVHRPVLRAVLSSDRAQSESQNLQHHRRHRASLRHALLHASSAPFPTRSAASG